MLALFLLFCRSKSAKRWADPLTQSLCLHQASYVRLSYSSLWSTPQIRPTVERKEKFFIASNSLESTMSEPTVIVADNGEEVSRELGKLIEAEANSVLQSPDSVLVIGLSGKKGLEALD